MGVRRAPCEGRREEMDRSSREPVLVKLLLVTGPGTCDGDGVATVFVTSVERSKTVLRPRGWCQKAQGIKVRT